MMGNELDPQRPVLALSSRLLWSVPVSRAAEIATALGFQGLEIWTEHLWKDGYLKKIKEQIDRFPLRYFLHAPFMDLNLCSRNPRVAKLSLAEQLRALKLACELAIRLVVVHPGRCSSSKEPAGEYWDRLLEALGYLEDRAAKLGIVLAVENMEPRPKEFMVRPPDFSRLLEELPGLGLCLDLAHAAAAGEAVPDEFVQKLGVRIRHVHISNVGEGRVHLPLDQGRVPLTPVVSRFLHGYTGGITLEGATESGFQAARVGLSRLRKILTGGDEGREETPAKNKPRTPEGGAV